MSSIPEDAYDSESSPPQLSRRHLVVGGHDIVKGRYPYFVSIDKNNGVIVNGALIAPDIVLSGGHIALNHMDNLTVTIGTYAVHDRANETAPGTGFAETIPVAQWMVAPTWRQDFTGTYFTDDFLILQLASAAAHAAPVRINFDQQVPAVHSDVVLMGLGWTRPDVLSPADIVQEVVLETVGNQACAAAIDPSRGLSYADIIVDSMLCTVAPPNTTRDGCAWDSGAPVILAGDDETEDLLVGLGSSGIGCADPVFPAIQARVSSGTDWIRQQVCALSVNPPADFHCDKHEHELPPSGNATMAPTSAAATTQPPPPPPPPLANNNAASPQISLWMAPLSAPELGQFSEKSAVLTLWAFAVFVVLGLAAARRRRRIALSRPASTTAPCTFVDDESSLLLLNGELGRHCLPSYTTVEE